MIWKLYFKYEGKKFSGNFLSPYDEEYTVNLKHGNHGHDLTVEWKEIATKYITVAIFKNLTDATDSQKVALVREKKCITLPQLNVHIGDTVLVIIDTCTHLKINTTVTHEGRIHPAKEEAIVEKKLEQLSKDMNNLLQTGELSDVVLVVSDDGTKEINAHKAILSLRSSVFAKMFQNPMKESCENRVIIEDVSSEVVMELLHFLYTGTVEIKDSRMAQELYVAADKYDVKDLREICSTKLQSVDLKNALYTFLLAHMYNDKLLKVATLNFISRNYKQIKALESWKMFEGEHPQLAIEILNFIVLKCSESS